MSARLQVLLVLLFAGCAARATLTPAQERIARDLAQGEAHVRAGDFAAAQQTVDRALREAEALDDRSARVEALLSLGRILESTEGPAAARARYEQAAALARRLGSAAGESAALAALGSLESQAGRAELAGPLLERALERARQSKDPRLLAKRLNDRAVAARRAGEPDRAIALYLEALGLQEDEGDRLGEALTRANLAVAFTERRQFAQAREHLEAALAILHRDGAPQQIATTLERLAVLEEAAGRPEAALDYCERAALAYRACKRTVEAEQMVERARSIVRRSSPPATGPAPVCGPRP